MKRDSLFFRFFKELPGCFFQLIGRSESDASRYTFDAIEYKETAVRLDGVFQPREPGDPAYLWEAQYYASDKVYANLWSKIGRFLEHGDPHRDWVAVVIYPNRIMEQKNLWPYRCLLESNQLVRIYLDELPPAAPDQFEMGILELIAEQPEAALAKAQSMVPRLRASKKPEIVQKQVIQFIETVVMYQLPKLSRKEIEAMLQVSDARETRVFQEGVEEGMEQGLEKGRKEGIEKGIEQVVLRMLELKRPIQDIAAATGLQTAQIRKLQKRISES